MVEDVVPVVAGGGGGAVLVAAVAGVLQVGVNLGLHLSAKRKENPLSCWNPRGRRFVALLSIHVNCLKLDRELVRYIAHWVQLHINLEIPVPIRSLKSSNVELG